MRPIRYSLALASLLGLLVALSACQIQRCSEGAVCSNAKVSGPSILPSPSPAAPVPSPSASPTPKPEDCRIDFMILQPRDGFTLAQGATGRVSLTPYQRVTNADGSVAQVEVSEGCNLPRVNSIVWASSSAAVTVGTGFEPVVTRVGVGVASVTATLEGRVSNAVTVR